MTAEDDEGPAVVLVIELSLVLTVALALLLLAGADDTEDMIRKKKSGPMPFQDRCGCLVCCGAGVDSYYRLVDDDDGSSLEKIGTISGRGTHSSWRLDDGAFGRRERKGKTAEQNVNSARLPFTRSS